MGCRVRVIKRFAHIGYWWIQELRSPYSISTIYDTLVAKGIYDNAVRYDRRVRQFRSALKHVHLDGAEVLDLACGTGAVEEALIGTGILRIVAVDVSGKMLGVAKQRLAHNQQVELLQENFMNLRFAESSFDLVTIAHATRFVPKGREKAFFNNIAKWLRQDGYFVAIIQDDLISLIFALLQKLVGVSNRHNLDMHFKTRLILNARGAFFLDKEIRIGKGGMMYNQVALYFKKPHS